MLVVYNVKIILFLVCCINTYVISIAFVESEVMKRHNVGSVPEVGHKRQ